MRDTMASAMRMRSPVTMRKSIRILGMVIGSRVIQQSGDALSGPAAIRRPPCVRTFRSSLAVRVLAAHTFSRRERAN